MVTSRTVSILMRRMAVRQSQHLREDRSVNIPPFIADTIERAIKSGAQTAVVFLGADKIDLLSVDWQTVLGLSGGAAALSVLTSLASLKIGNSGTASLTSAVEPAPGQ